MPVRSRAAMEGPDLGPVYSMLLGTFGESEIDIDLLLTAAIVDAVVAAIGMVATGCELALWTPRAVGLANASPTTRFTELSLIDTTAPPAEGAYADIATWQWQWVRLRLPQIVEQLIGMTRAGDCIYVVLRAPDGTPARRLNLNRRAFTVEANWYADPTPRGATPAGERWQGEEDPSQMQFNCCWGDCGLCVRCEEQEQVVYRAEGAESAALASPPATPAVEQETPQQQATQDSVGSELWPAVCSRDNNPFATCSGCKRCLDEISK